MSKDEDWEKKYKSRRFVVPVDYEAILRHLCGTAKRIPKDIPGSLLHPLLENRGGADGYAEADIWRRLDQEGKITDVDVGFVIALQSLAVIVASLEIRIEQLERELRAK